MSTLPTSSIRVFVRWKENTVFAGEDVQCEITFKNVAVVPASSRASLHPNLDAYQTGGHRTAPSAQPKGSPLNPHTTQFGKGHRSALSLTAPASSLRSPTVSGSWPSRNPVRNHGEPGKHQRSVSIISIGTNDAVTDDGLPQSGHMERVRPSRGHGRAASLQIVPRGLGVNGISSAGASNRLTTQHSPVFNFPPPAVEFDRSSRRRAGVASVPNVSKTAGPSSSTRRKGSGGLVQTWKFPTNTVPSPKTATIAVANDELSKEGKDFETSPRSELHANTTHITPITRVISATSIAGTPRSSGEFYSLSNNSTETLASEYVPQHLSRISHGSHVRRPSNMPSMNPPKSPETLMMGYAQINGSFTLDGSLISQTPFEEVKRKGAVGGQGGGVIGIDSKKRESGLFRGFGWNSLGESLGGILGTNELSSMKDMRGLASSRSIPLLSTPQSILFVDLCLAPGESKSYDYSFKLPRGLPPSHRGKAIKIMYKLVIGTQRPGGANEQQVKSIDIPFRILGSVNSHGELLGHDLMSPYIVLRDQARVQAVEHSLRWESRRLKVQNAKISADTSSDFLRYVDELLTRPRLDSSLGLLSPTEAPRSRRQSYVEEPSTVKETIDMAILRSNVATELQQSANKFEIARGGKRVAVILLARPAYRLGETISTAIDFNQAEIPCYAVHISLETSERVDSSIALRSDASIQRVTKKIYASHSESALFARRVVFSPSIPLSATPEFITTGVSLDWRIRVEFVTPTLTGQGEAAGYPTELMEQISHDDRGRIFAATETLSCESFEIAVPIRVYGATGHTEKDEVNSEGYAI